MDKINNLEASAKEYGFETELNDMKSDYLEYLDNISYTAIKLWMF